MIYDADVHFCVRHFFDELKEKHPRFVEFYNESCRTIDLDKIWCQCYENIKDSDWPKCSSRDDFYQLPAHIKSTLQNRLENEKLIQIIDDILCVDHYENHCPDLDTTLTSMKLLGVDKQSLTPYPPFSLMFYQTDSQLAVDLMRCWNDRIWEISQKHQEFNPVAWVALQDKEASQQELEKIADRGFSAVYVNDDCLSAFTPELWWVFELCEKLNIPIFLHPTKYNPYPLPWMQDTNEKYHIMRQQFPSPLQYWKVNIMGLVTEGVLDKFPNLKLIIAEHGLKWVPEVCRFMTANGWPNPLPYFKKNFWFTTEPDEEKFLLLAGLVGWDRLLFGSDYPHNDFGGMNRYNDTDLLNSFLTEKKISQEQYDLITHKNYISLRNAG
jgi:hypothetical protein